MERLEIDQARVDELRAEQQAYYTDCAEPLPGSFLKLDDDVLWLGEFPMRVVWGYEMDQFFQGYCPGGFGDVCVIVEGALISDRAPKNAEEPSLPIYPEPEPEPEPEQQQQSAGDEKAHKKKRDQKPSTPAPLTLEDKRRIVAMTLCRIGDEAQKRAREKLRETHPELLDPP